MSFIFDGVFVKAINFLGTSIKKVVFNGIDVWNSLRTITWSASNTNSISSELDGSKTLTIRWSTPTVEGDASLLRVDDTRVYATDDMRLKITCKFGGSKRSSGKNDGYNTTGRVYKNGVEVAKWSAYEDGTSGKFITRTWTLNELEVANGDYIYVTETITNRTSVSNGQSSVTIEGYTI